CKNLSTPADANLVRLTHAAKDLHRAHKGILICPSGFTKPALENAEALRVMTWGPEELRLLYHAASSEAAMRKLGLWEAPKSPGFW
ncbi:restriction endonuclease, partial [Acinetobacter baumannii]